MSKDPTLSDFPNSTNGNEDTKPIEIKPEQFNEFWRELTAKRNEEENHPERNDPSHSWPIGRIEPHQIGNCKRKWFYRWLNAPAEEADPHGIFAIGHFIEEEIIEKWLKAEFQPKYNIDNAVHVGTNLFTITIDDVRNKTNNEDKKTPLIDHIPFNQGIQNNPDTETDTLTTTIAGSTDPLIRDPNSDEPIALTEVKTTSNLERQKGAKKRHKYQLHAYLKSLGIEKGFIIYVDRNKLLNPKIFEITFDEEIWEEVKSWSREITEIAITGELPAANPPESWMCNYCEYENRCGKGRSNTASDMGPIGFVPGYTGYPEQKIQLHLKAHDSVKLTPSLALKYPQLAEEYGTEKWVCPSCDQKFEYDNPKISDFENGEFDTPSCPLCESVFNHDNIRLTTEDYQ